MYLRDSFDLLHLPHQSLLFVLKLKIKDIGLPPLTAPHVQPRRRVPQLIRQATDIPLVEPQEPGPGEDGIDPVLQFIVSNEFVDEIGVRIQGGEDVVEGEVVGLEGGIPEEEIPLEMEDDLVGRVVLLVHDLLPDLLEQKTKRNPLVKGLPPQQLGLEVDDLVEDVAVLGPTHLRQLFDLEDVQQVLEGQELELLPEILPQVLLGEQHHRHSLAVHPDQGLQQRRLLLTLLHIVKDRPRLRPPGNDLLPGELAQLDQSKLLGEFELAHPKPRIAHTEQPLPDHVPSQEHLVLQGDPVLKVADHAADLHLECLWRQRPLQDQPVEQRQPLLGLYEAGHLGLAPHARPRQFCVGFLQLHIFEGQIFEKI